MEKAFQVLSPHGMKMAEGMAVVSTSMVMASQSMDLYPSTGRNMNPCDRVEVPLEGALSFVLYGLKSTLIEQDEGYIVFRDKREPELPSKYMFQYTLERVVFHKLYTIFRGLPGDYTVTRRSELLDLHAHIMSLYFTKPDPDSRARLEALLNINTTFPVGAVRVPMPPALQSALYENSRIQAPAAPLPVNGLVKGFSSSSGEDEDAALEIQEYPQADVSPYIRSFDAMHKVVRKVYILFEPSKAKQMLTYDGRLTMAWNDDIDEETLVDFEDIIRAELYHTPGPMDYQKMVSMAKFYLRKNNIQGRKGIMVKDIYTKFELFEVKATEDVVVENIEITVEVSKQFRDLSKYDVGTIRIPVYKISDMHDQDGGNFVHTRVQNVMNYLCIPKETFEECMVHINNVNAMAPGLYKREMQNGRIAEVEQDELTQQRVFGWNGVLYSSRFSLSKRLKEDIKVKSELIRTETLI